MNKKFLSAILFGALMVTSTGTFVSCKDYDDDIDSINKELTEIKSQIAALQNKVDAGNYVTNITKAENGINVAFSNGTTSFVETAAKVEVEKAETATIVGGEWVITKVDGSKVETGIPASGVLVSGSKTTGYILSVVNAAGEITEIKLPAAGSTVADVEFMGVTALNALDANLSEDAIEDELSVEYAWIQKIVKAYDGNKETTWSAQKEVKKGQVLTTLAPNNQKLIARIEAGADAADLAFSLKNSKGNQLPISVGTAAQYTGTLSRAAGLYALSLDNTDAVYAKAADYTGLYKDGLYAMVEDAGFTSNYNLTVSAEEADVVEGMVAKVGGKSINGGSYEVNLNKDLALEFDANSKYVYDYYVEAKDATLAAMFGFSADKSNGTFKVTKLSDAISIATFDLNVYKLHIDGKIYKETITIKPMRTIAKEVVYNLGEQTIKNEMKLTVDLADMFTALGDDAAIWKNATLGAKTHAEVVKIGNDAATLADVVYTHKNANGSTESNLNASTKLEITFDATKNGEEGKEAALKVGKEYTITVTYSNNEGKLNEIKIKFTPVMPALASYIAKREAVWNENTLMAYFAEPETPWAATDLDPKYNLLTGFTKLGSTEAADKTVITLSLDADQKIQDKKVVETEMAKLTGTEIQLYKTTIGNTEKFWAYAQELNVKVAAKYLDVYEFTEAEIKAAAFTIKVQSALEAGKVVPAEGNVITIPAAAAGEYAKLTADMITGYTYNNQPYSLFMNATATATGYKYTYIKDVKFETVDAVLYTIVDTDTDATDGVTETIWDAEAKKEVVGYVQINSGQLSNTTTTEIKVTVSDRFGFSKVVKVPVKITVGE